MSTGSFRFVMYELPVVKKENKISNTSDRVISELLRLSGFTHTLHFTSFTTHLHTAALLFVAARALSAALLVDHVDLKCGVTMDERGELMCSSGVVLGEDLPERACGRRRNNEATLSKDARVAVSHLGDAVFLHAQGQWDAVLLDQHVCESW